MSEMNSMSTVLISSIVGATALGVGMLLLYNKNNSCDNKNKHIEPIRYKETDKKSNTLSRVDQTSLSSKDNELRGYKITPEGKKTTYFHRELSAQDKQILGDSTPKRIDTNTHSTSTSTSTVPPISTSEKSMSSSSRSGASKPIISSSPWNSAGTWEERNVSGWAKQQLTTRLNMIAISISSNQLITVSVSTLVGDAIMTMTRGKIKCIYDFTMTLSWKLTVNHLITATGSLEATEVTPDMEYEINIKILTGNTAMNSSLLDEYVRKSSGNIGLIPAVTEQLNLFYNDFKELSQN